MATPTKTLRKKEYAYGFLDPETSVIKIDKGLNEKAVRAISDAKNEPAWMREFRLRALQWFNKKPLPPWGPDLSAIDFNAMTYFLRSTEKTARTWEDVPETIKNTFTKLGIPQAEQKFLAGVGAQYESEVVYHSLHENLEKQGVIFLDTDTALRTHPELFRQYFGKVIPPGDNKFAALNSAVWSGGSFIYVPKGVKVDMPLQAYFRINAQNMGQFERTLIIADEGSFVHYVEGCSAPNYTTDSLHSAVVEIIVKKGARVRYSTVQNWSNSVYNLVTKRATCEEEGVMEWIDGNFGSRITMKYPSVYLLGRKSRAHILSLAFAGKGQHQDAGGKAIHVAPETRSTIISKSISQENGRSSFRGMVQMLPGAVDAHSRVQCDALLLDAECKSDTYPTMDIQEQRTTMEHEATVTRIGPEQLFYLTSRGIPEKEASQLVVNGFIEPIVKELPMEFAVEMNRLIAFEMEGSVG